MASWLKKSIEMAIAYEKNGATPPGFEPGAQIKMIRRVTTVPRSRDPMVLRTLIDSCCTGWGLIPFRIVKDLSLQVQDAPCHGTRRLVDGNFESLGYVKTLAVILNVSSQDRIILLEIEVIPDERHVPYR